MHRMSGSIGPVRIGCSLSICIVSLLAVISLVMGEDFQRCSPQTTRVPQRKKRAPPTLLPRLDDTLIYIDESSPS